MLHSLASYWSKGVPAMHCWHAAAVLLLCTSVHGDTHLGPKVPNLDRDRLGIYLLIQHLSAAAACCDLFAMNMIRLVANVRGPLVRMSVWNLRVTRKTLAPFGSTCSQKMTDFVSTVIANQLL
jgi:hypothetical protein